MKSLKRYIGTGSKSWRRTSERPTLNVQRRMETETALLSLRPTATTEGVTLCVTISSKLQLCDSRIADNVKKRGRSFDWVLRGGTRASRQISLFFDS